MYLTVKQKVKHLSKEEYGILRELCHTAKNFTNEAIYNVRQYYFTEGEYLKYEKIIDYCIVHDIGTLVIGYNETFQRNCDRNKCNNQNFVNIPYGKLRSKLEYICERNGIVFVKQEESDTSKASFWDNDTIPVYNADNRKSYNFSGKRVQRGLYKTADGTLLNADVNGALNIMKKSRVVDLTVLYRSGEVDTPVRIRIA